MVGSLLVLAFHGLASRFPGVLAGLAATTWLAGSEPALIPLQPASAWQRVEFAVTNIPTVANPFDPAQIQVDDRFTLPSGRTQQVPGFWFLDHSRALVNGVERLVGSHEQRRPRCHYGSRRRWGRRSRSLPRAASLNTGGRAGWGLWRKGVVPCRICMVGSST